MRFEVSATDKLLHARHARHAINPRRYYHEAYPDAEPKPAPPPPSRGFSIRLELPQTKYDSQSGRPPNSLRSVNLDWIRIRKIQPSPSITVRYVRVQKLWIRPGTPNTFQIALENFTDQPQKRTLALTLTRGFDEAQEIYRQDVELAPVKATTSDIPWPTTSQTPHWGYEVRADILAGETVESTARDFFQVSPHVYPVHIMGSNCRRNDPFRQNESYQNLVEVFGATPGDCARVMPKEDAWMSGMFSGGTAMTMKIVQAMTRGNRENGIASHMYLFAGGTGMAMMDIYVEHPEWVGSRADATDILYRLMKERTDAIRQHDWSKGFIDPAHADVPHIECHLNHWFPELKQRIEQQTLEFVRATGYEGIRFDVGIFGPRTNKTILGTTLPFDMKDAQTHAAQNFIDYRDKLQAEFPGFEFGANMDTWAYLEQVGNRNVTPEPPEKFPEFVAFAQSGGMFMDEGTMSAPFYDHYMNRWEDALWGMAQKRDMAGRFGGVYQLFSPHRDGNGYFAHDDIYFAVCIIASGSHYVGHFSAPPYTRDSIGEFITRFSEFYWNPFRRLLPDARDTIFVDAPADVWFADVTSYENIGNTRRYIIPLINPPVVERLRRNKINELPPPIEEPFNVEIQLPDGFTKADAWMLTWEPTVMARKLPAAIDGDTVTVPFPALQLFRTLVLDFTP